MKDQLRPIFKRALSRYAMSVFGLPSGPIKGRVNLKLKSFVPTLDNIIDKRGSRRNRRIIATHQIGRKELDYHATKGWRMRTVAA